MLPLRWPGQHLNIFLASTITTHLTCLGVCVSVLVEQQCRVVFMRLAVVQWLRGLVVIGTSLPGPALHCRAGPHYRADIPASATMVLTQQGQILGLVKSCGDLIYSGQSATLMVLLITLYVPFAPECLWRHRFRGAT